jgi:hypothetical protein
MTEKKKYVITVSRISSFLVEARDREHAEELGIELLDNQDEGIQDSIELGDSGWEVTDVEERD